MALLLSQCSPVRLQMHPCHQSKSLRTRIWNGLENFLQFRLLVRGQTRREPDFNLHNKVTTFAGILGFRHSLSWESLLISRQGWSGARYAKLPTVDGGDGTAPARQSFFEVEFNGCYQVVSDTLIRMCFLLEKFSHAVCGQRSSADMAYLTSVTMKWRSWVPPSS